MMTTLDLRHLTLTRPLAVLDVETTGTDAARDRIVELALLTLHPGRNHDLYQTRLNPGVPIPPAATAVHGITDADVRDAPTFATIAPDLVRRLTGCDLAGFGIGSFDLPLLCAEFVRVGMSFRLHGRAVLDALTVYRRHEARTLSAAVQFYLGHKHTAAHAAAGDAVAAAGVLDAQVGRYGLPLVPMELHTLLHPVDVGGKFQLVNGAVAFAFGKHAGRRLSDVAATDPGYLEWVLTRPFLPDVHHLVRSALAARRR
jgi:DNA polymerase III subunit epsilon